MEIHSSVSCDNSLPSRSAFDIIWSCFTTLFICVWVAVHPNIPDPDETWFAIKLRRASLMLLALIAPELVIAWALRQLIVARRLKSELQAHGWTLVHGFFASMGGFTGYRDDEVRTLSIQDLKSLREIEMTGSPPSSVNHLPTSSLVPFQIDVTKEEIEDKSKGDMLSKGLAIMQSAWFALQCISRPLQNLPLTELELVTLAFTTLNFAIYVLWWFKPLDVGCPITVAHKLACSREEEDRPGMGIRMTCWAAIMQASHAMSNCSWAGSKKALLEFGRTIYETNITIINLFHAIFGLVEREDIPLLTYWDATVESLKEPEGDNLRDPMARRVPTFYAGALTPYEQKQVRLAAAVVATIFGAIHCIGWSFHFASRTEQMLWRISSVVITYLPAHALVFSMIFSNSKHEDVNAWLALPGGLLYLSSRLALLVLPFTSLRSLPPGAHDTVDVWTTFIPHIQ